MVFLGGSPQAPPESPCGSRLRRVPEVAPEPKRLHRPCGLYTHSGRHEACRRERKGTRRDPKHQCYRGRDIPLPCFSQWRGTLPLHYHTPRQHASPVSKGQRHEQRNHHRSLSPLRQLRRSALGHLHLDVDGRGTRRVRPPGVRDLPGLGRPHVRNRVGRSGPRPGDDGRPGVRRRDRVRPSRRQRPRTLRT